MPRLIRIDPTNSKTCACAAAAREAAPGGRPAQPASQPNDGVHECARERESELDDGDSQGARPRGGQREKGEGERRKRKGRGEGEGWR